MHLQEWYFVFKNFPTYFEKKQLLKIETEGREFAILFKITTYNNLFQERKNNFLNRILF